MFELHSGCVEAILNAMVKLANPRSALASYNMYLNDTIFTTYSMKKKQVIPEMTVYACQLTLASNVWASLTKAHVRVPGL